MTKALNKYVSTSASGFLVYYDKTLSIQYQPLNQQGNPYIFLAGF